MNARTTFLPSPGTCEPAGVTSSAAAGDSPAAADAFAHLPGTGAGGSIASVLAKRLDQVRRGYGPDHDAALPPTHLVDEAAKYAADAHDLIRRQDAPDRIRLKLVNAAALLLAAIDDHDRRHPQGE